MARPLVVSLTPHRVDRDSRTFKGAASLARAGYGSVVVEGQASAPGAVTPFPVLTAGHDVVRGRPGGPADAVLGSWPARRAASVAETLAFRWARPALEAGRWAWRQGPVTARSLPAADLVVLHSPLQAPALGLLGPGRGARVPFVYDAHDFYPPDRGEALRDRALERAERRCVAGAEAVTTATEGTARLIEEHFGRRPLVLRNVHDPRIDEPVATGLRATLGLGDDAVLVVMVGNDKPGTAVEEALTAMCEAPEAAHLALVGGGWEAWRDRVAALGLTGRVHLLPPVPPTQVVPFVRSADAAVVLYHPLTVDYLHALPNRLFIPVGAGLPLLYPEHLPELAALARAHDLGLPVDPQVPATLVAALRRLVVEPDLRAGLAANARAAAEVLSWEREERVLLDVVEEAVGPPTGGR